MELMDAPNHTSHDPKPLDPGHPYSRTTHIPFPLYRQIVSAAPYGYDYFVSLPPSYNSSTDRSYPLILFLHGSGESKRGKDETYAALRHGIPKIILCYDKLKSGEEPRIDIPLAGRFKGQNPNKGKGRNDADLSTKPVPEEVCKIVAEEFITVTPVLDMNDGYGWNASVLTSLLDTIMSQYRADPARVHVTGFSMGGYGTWDLALHTPDRFATLSPVCGGGDKLRVSLIKDIPQWVHHGELDDIVPIGASEEMVKALNAVGAKEVKFSRYPDAAHDSWTEAYNNPELWRWMLDHKRADGGRKVELPEDDKVDVELVK